MKILCLVIVVFCCFCVAFLIKRFYEQKYNFYNNLLMFCDYVINNISANNEKINIILDKNYNLYKRDFSRVLNFYKAYLKKEIQFDEFLVKTKSNLLFLDSEEKNNVISFFKNLGFLTKDEEIANITNKRIYWNAKLNYFVNTKKKNGELYFKLFIILGLVLFIIFI